jgi:hypothetical protein
VTRTPLTSRALAAALAVAAKQGLRCDEPEILRDASNLLVLLRPAPVVARITTVTSTVRHGDAWLAREVAMASHLAAAGAPERTSARGSRHSRCRCRRSTATHTCTTSSTPPTGRCGTTGRTASTARDARRYQGTVWSVLMARRHPDEERLQRARDLLAFYRERGEGSRQTTNSGGSP